MLYDMVLRSLTETQVIFPEGTDQYSSAHLEVDTRNLCDLPNEVIPFAWAEHVDQWNTIYLLCSFQAFHPALGIWCFQYNIHFSLY